MTLGNTILLKCNFFLLILCATCSCSQNPSPYVKTKLLIEAIASTDSTQIPEPLQVIITEKLGQLSLQNIGLIKELVEKHGFPKKEQFQIERVQPQSSYKSNTDSTNHIFVHVSFGQQKEAPIPVYIVNFIYTEDEGNLILQKIDVLNFKNPLPNKKEILSFQGIEYNGIVEFSTRLESGYKNLDFQRFDYDINALAEKEISQISHFLTLLNAATIDSTFISSDIPRTFGNPEVGAVFIKLKNETKQWMIYYILSEEPGRAEPNNEWMFLRNFEYANNADTYLIRKSSHQALLISLNDLVTQHNLKSR